MFAQLTSFVRGLGYVAPLRRTKVCRKCGGRKPIGEFSANRTRADGKQVWCKACYAVNGKAWYRKKKAKEKRRAKRANGGNKVSPLTIRCARCGKRKAPSRFYVNKAMKNGRQSWCKECYTEYMAERRQS